MRLSMVGTTKALVTCSASTQAQPFGNVEIGQLDDTAPGIDRAQQRRDTRDMIGRHRDQRRALLLGRGELHRSDDVGKEISVPQDRGLGLAGGAAGEELHRDRLVRRLVQRRLRGIERRRQEGSDRSSARRPDMASAAA